MHNDYSLFPCCSVRTKGIIGTLFSIFAAAFVFTGWMAYTKKGENFITFPDLYPVIAAIIGVCSCLAGMGCCFSACAESTQKPKGGSPV